MNSTVIRISLRSLFGRRRGILLFILPALLIAVAVLVRYLAGDSQEAAENVLGALGLTIVVPLVALIAATGVLAPEIDDGSIVYLLAKPLSRYGIVASKMLVAIASVFAFGAVPMFVSSMIIATSEPGLALGLSVASLASGAAYTAFFSLLSVLTRHAVVVGLLYLVVWESLLGGLLDGVRWLSISWWAATIAEEFDGTYGVAGQLSIWYATVATLVVLFGGGWLAGHKLRAFNLTGDE